MATQRRTTTLASPPPGKDSLVNINSLSSDSCNHANIQHTYYDDDSDNDDEQGSSLLTSTSSISTTTTRRSNNHSTNNEMFNNACPIGQFFLDPWTFMFHRCQRMKSQLSRFRRRSSGSNKRTNDDDDHRRQQKQHGCGQRICLQRAYLRMIGITERGRLSWKKTTLRQQKQQQQQQKQSGCKRTRVFYILSLIFLTIIITMQIVHSPFQRQERVPIVIQSFNYVNIIEGHTNTEHDLGGYLSPQVTKFKSWRRVVSDTNNQYYYSSEEEESSKDITQKSGGSAKDDGDDKEEKTEKDETEKENSNDNYSDRPDYGGLKLSFPKEDNYRRVIQPNNNDKQDTIDDMFLDTNTKSKKNKKKKKNKRKRSFNSYYEMAHSQRQRPKDCQSPTWRFAYYPNCNFFHEFDIRRDYQTHVSKEDQEDYESQYISHGYYRDVWVLKQHHQQQQQPTTESMTKGSSSSNNEEFNGQQGHSSSADDAMALKMLRYTEHEVSESTIETVHSDALVMERLSASPRIINMYGHCSTSVGVELVDLEVEDVIVPNEGVLPKGTSRSNGPFNHYTPTEKLEMALAMAESIADLHGFKDGIIVHDDVQLCQWLRKSSDGRLVLGDFNRAEVMEYDEEKQMYCKYNNGSGYGTYRSPEEFASRDLNEKIDIFSYGNNIYSLLTGLWIFNDIEDDGVVQDKLIGGELDVIDDQYRHRSFAEGKLVEIMERCWEYDPDKRIDIFEIVSLLQNAVKENQVKEQQLYQHQQQ